MKKEIILKHEANQNYKWLRFFFKQESKISFDNAENIIANIFIDNKDYGSYNLSLLVDINQKQNNVVQLNISNLSFDEIKILFQNLTQEKHTVIGAGLA